MNDLRVVPCPVCGKDKWAFVGREPGRPEPPCLKCQALAQQVVEPEHCKWCGSVRKLSSCAMCGARVCRFCERGHLEGHDDGDLPTAAQIQNAISWGRDV